MSVQCALFEYMDDDGELFKTSAVLFDSRWIIVPAATFIIHVTSNSKRILPEVLENLRSAELFEDNYLNLQSHNIRVITDVSTRKHYKIQNAKYVGIFSCRNIKDSVEFPLACGENNDKYNYDNFLSLFLILDLNLELMFYLKHLQESISKYLKLARNWKINRGTSICIESIPFGTKELFGSYSQGIISNTSGKSSCFLLTDASTAPGAEGAPIFAAADTSKALAKCPIGVVISSINSWRGEHTGLTLGAFLQPLLGQLLPTKRSLADIVFSSKNSFHKLVDKSLVQVFCDNGWGSGILIDKCNGIFITNSHVVRTDFVQVKWKKYTFPCSVLFRTGNHEIYDVAVLKSSPRYTEEMVQIKIASNPAVQGEKVLAAGYPIFKSEDMIFPVVTKGNVSLVDGCVLHTTCVILPGASGGAIVRTNGELIGMIVCHMTVTKTNDLVVYPRINMAIPISVIYKPLAEFIRTKDVSKLECLQVTNVDVLKKWQVFRGKL